MQKNRMSAKQAVSVLTLFIMGSSLVVGGNTDAKQDAWIAILVAAFLFAPMLMVYARLLSLHPGQGLYEIVLDVFGRIIGKAIIFLYVLYSIYLGALVMRNFSEFMQAVAIPETPQLVTLIFGFVLCVWMVKKGAAVLGRWAKFVFPIALAAIAVTILLSLKFMDPDNLKPVLGTDFGTLMSSSFSLFAFPLAETILFTSLFGSVQTKSENTPYGIYISAVLISIVLFLLVALRNILVLGAPVLSMFYFPSYEVVSVLSLGDFFTRFEVLIGMIFMFAGFVKICVCLFSATAGIAKLIHVRGGKDLAVPVGLLMMTIATIVFSNTLQMVDEINIYKYFALPFQVILPLVILAGAEIKTRLKKPAGGGAGG